MFHYEPGKDVCSVVDVEVVCKCQFDPVDYGAVWFNSILTDSWLRDWASRYVNYRERVSSPDTLRAEVSAYNYGFFCFSFQLYPFLPRVI